MGETPTIHSQERIMTIFMRLLAGQSLAKQALADEYHKSAKAIQRDMMQIASAIDAADFADQLAVVQRTRGTYTLERAHATNLNDTQLLAICQVLLASRGLANAEMATLVDQVLGLAKDGKRLETAIKSDLVAYHGVPQSSMLAKLTVITEAIQKRQVLQFRYFRDTQAAMLTRRPTAVFFSDLYFWMTTDNDRAYDDMDVTWLSKFRLTLMADIQVVGHSEDTSRAKHFEAGEFRKQTTLPFLGNPVTLVIDYYSDPQYVLDRFPGAKVTASAGVKPPWAMQIHRVTIPANDGYGIKMWLLQQAHMVKIISPQSLRDYVTERMRWALAYYDE